MIERADFPNPGINLVRPASPVEATIVKTELCMNGKSASFVRHIDVDLAGTGLEGSFHAGQSLAVIPPGVRENGKPEKARLYSVSSPTHGADGEGRVISLCVKRVVDEYRPQRPSDPESGPLFLGKCSNYLCDQGVGDRILVAGPSGRRFVLPTNPGDHQFVFLATGTGIAPFRGFLLDLQRSGALDAGVNVSLLMGVAYETDLLYHNEMVKLAERYTNFNYQWICSRHPAGGMEKKGYLPKLLRASSPSLEILNEPSSLMYICGLAGMQRGVFEVLVEAGLQKQFLRETTRGERIHLLPNARCMVEVY